jgi:hypothetical protein
MQWLISGHLDTFFILRGEALIFAQKMDNAVL